MMKQRHSVLIVVLLFIGACFSLGVAKEFTPSGMDEILYGVAYYYEYMPYERLEEDARMMKECGINFVRICESTWGYHERQDGEFHLDHIGRIMDVMHKHGIKVIIGTPTYAVPTWLAKKYPEILADRKEGRTQYGSRQNMDITHPVYRFYAERMIRKLIEYTYDHPSVIGFQVDNETKHYQTEGDNVQKQFVQYLKTKFKTPEEMNQAFGFHYWSNSVNAWEDMPSTKGSINGSLNCEFDKFQRKLVTDFLAWQVSIVNEYKKPEQFVTQNFDLSWRSGSYAIQADVDHFEASMAMDIAGIDIYHKTQDDLDGMTIGMAGDLARSMKQDNYLVVETSGQSILNSAQQRLHYPGQLRLQAYSHVASGANMVAYWPWHSIHNSAETYWKGILSHDMEPNPTYYEAQQIATEFKKYSKDLIGLKKNNQVAIYFSNESLSAIREFPFSYSIKYNDIVRQLYDILYKSNIECDFVDHTVEDLSQYKLVIVPPLYVASDQELQKLNTFAENGGSILYYFKSGFCNENVKVRTDRMPAVIRKACGFNYQRFTNFDKMPLKENPFNVPESENYVSVWGELLNAESAEVLASYDHPHWGKYAAMTQNKFGKGTITYFASLPSRAIIKKVVDDLVQKTGLEGPNQNYKFPIIVRNGKNKQGKKVHYLINYSSESVEVDYYFGSGKDLLEKVRVKTGDRLSIKPWNLRIIIE